MVLRNKENILSSMMKVFFFTESPESALFPSYYVYILYVPSPLFKFVYKHNTLHSDVTHLGAVCYT